MLTQADLVGLLGQAGRQRNLGRRAAELQQALTSPQLTAPAAVTAAYGQVVAATVGILAELNQQISTLEQELSSAFEAHPDGEILPSGSLLRSVRLRGSGFASHPP
jgi:hypothetical protein